MKETNLPEEVFGLRITPALVQQAAVTQMANMRQVLAHTKDRGEVRGGGKKPWRQKGTGRARHGSRRSPIWVGGGVTFGPTNERNFSKKLNKKMKQKAILMALSGKIRDNELVVIDNLEIKEGKTKEMAAILNKLVPGGESAMMIVLALDNAMQKSGRNIPGFKVGGLNGMNIIDLLSYKYLIVTNDVVGALTERYAEKGETEKEVGAKKETAEKKTVKKKIIKKKA